MRKSLLVLLLATLLLPACCHAEKSGVLVIVDGLGSTYIYYGHSPACVDGSLLPAVSLDVIANATARYELQVPEPETEAGNAVIATGYRDASGEMFSYYGATIYDAVRAAGYLSIAIVETGDTVYMTGEPDIIAYEKNNSQYVPCTMISVNSQSVPAGVQDILAANPLQRQSKNMNPADAYRLYDQWPLDRAVAMVRFLDEKYPGLKYLLVVNVAGPDMAAQERGFDHYRQAVEDLDPGLSSLADACREVGTIMMVTADHGMSFKAPGSKGSHATGEASLRNESRLAPLVVFLDEPGNRSGVYGQECVAPTLLSLMECPDTLTIENGEPVHVCDSQYFTEKKNESKAAPGWAWAWPPYLLVAALSATGLAVALWLLKGR
jgi:hypothetical protein